MDIAEIRKKAKGQKEAVHVPVKAAAPAPIPDQLSASDSGDVAPVAAVLPSETAGQTSLRSGLDRLFLGSDAAGQAGDDLYRATVEADIEKSSISLCQYLAFQLGPEEYALDIAKISEIIKLREFTDIPRVPGFIVGLISLRGVVVPVFDLRRRFKLGEALISAASRIIVCREGDIVAGLLVDSINQVINLSAERIEPPPSVLSGIDRNMVDGVGRYQGRMIILLDLLSVVDAEMV